MMTGRRLTALVAALAAVAAILLLLRSTREPIQAKRLGPTRTERALKVETLDAARAPQSLPPKARRVVKKTASTQAYTPASAPGTQAKPIPLPSETAKRAAQAPLVGRDEALKEKNGVYGYNSAFYGATLDRGRVEFATAVSLKDLGQPRLSYRFEELKVGDAVLAKASGTAPEIRPEQRTVFYAHGSVEEQYILRQESMEQAFVVAELPPERGAITVTGGIETNLELPVSGARLSFKYRGHEVLSISEAVAVDAAGRKLSLELAYADGKLSMTVPAGWVAEAKLPIVIDPLIGGPITVDGSISAFVDTVRGRAVRISDVAWSSVHDYWLVTWSERFGASAFDFDVFALRLDAQGNAVGGALAVAATTAGEYECTVSYGANTYLVAWRHDPADNASDADQDIAGRIVNGDGTFAGAAFMIDSAPNQDFAPSLAFDGTNWFCVFANAFSNSEQDVLGRFVSTLGVAGLAADPDVETDFASRPSVDFQGAAYLIAWEKGPSAAEMPQTIMGRAMNAAGAFTTAAVMIDQSTHGCTFADVSAGNGKFMVAWQHAAGGVNHNIFGRIVNPDLTFPGNFFVIATGTSDQVTPRADFSAANAEWFTVYSDPLTGGTDIYGNRVTSTGTVLLAERLTQNLVTDRRPELAWSSSRNEILVTYLAGSTAPFDLQAQRYSMDFIAPAATGQPTASPNPNNTGAHTVSWSAATDTGGSGIAAYELERSADAGLTFAPVVSQPGISFAEPGIAEGSYIYRVRVKDGAGNLSEYSPNSAAVVVDKTAPGAPSGLSQFRTDETTAISVGGRTPEISVVLKGTVSDAGTVTTRVKLQVEVKNTATVFADAATGESGFFAGISTASVSQGPFAEAGYHWQARAVDEAGNVSPFVPFGANPETAADFIVDLPPAAPVNLTATAGDATVALDWNDNTEADLVGYNVYRSIVSGGPYTKINASLVVPSAYADTGLTNGTSYFYVVRAVDQAAQESSNSNQASATPMSTGPLAAPVVTTASKKTRNVTPRVQGTAQPNVTVKVFFNGAQDGTTMANGAGAWTYDATTKAEGFYTVYARASNVSGDSANSNSITITIDITPPTPPTNVRTTSFAGCIDVEWDSSVAADLAGYNVYRKTGATGTWGLLNTAGMVLNTKYRDESAGVGVTYHYRVTAIDNCLNE